jgi:hypothetical protein
MRLISWKRSRGSETLTVLSIQCHFWLSLAEESNACLEHKLAAQLSSTN